MEVAAAPSLGSMVARVGCDELPECKRNQSGSSGMVNHTYLAPVSSGIQKSKNSAPNGALLGPQGSHNPLETPPRDPAQSVGGRGDSGALPRLWLWSVVQGFPFATDVAQVKETQGSVGGHPRSPDNRRRQRGGSLEPLPFIGHAFPRKRPRESGGDRGRELGGSRARERLTERQRQENDCLVGFVPLASADYCGLNMWRWVESGCASRGGAGYQETQGPRRAS